MPQNQTFFLVLFNIFLLIMMFLLTRKAKRYPFRISRPNRRAVIFLSFVFVMFSFWGTDWFHYLELYPDLRNGDDSHLENVYTFIARYASFGYISFRFVIWGGALWLFYMMLKKLPIDRDIAIFLFCSVWIIWFSYARVSLVMAMAGLGVGILYDSSLKRLHKLIGILLIAASVVFHKSSLFLIIVFILALCINIFKGKMRILLMFFLVTGLSYIVSILFSTMFLEDILGSSDFLNDSLTSGQQYMESDERSMGMGELLQRALEFIPYYLLAFEVIVLFWHNKDTLMPKSISVFASMLLLTVFISSMFAILSDSTTATIFVRFMRFSIIPTVVVLAYLLGNGINRKYNRFIVSLAIAGAMYTLTYSLYCSIM